MVRGQGLALRASPGFGVGRFGHVCVTEEVVQGVSRWLRGLGQVSLPLRACTFICQMGPWTAHREAVKLDLVPFLPPEGAVPLTWEEGPRPQEVAGSWEELVRAGWWAAGWSQAESGDCSTGR